MSLVAAKSTANQHTTNACYYLCLVAVAISTLSASAFAQETDRGAIDVDRASLVRATRIMHMVDKDGNGTFEKREDVASWKRYRKLDANRDGVLSLGHYLELLTLDTNQRFLIHYLSDARPRNTPKC